MSPTKSVAVFLKYPEPGKVKTRLACSIGNVSAAQAYGALVTEVFAILRNSDFDDLWICFDPAEKAGEIEEWLKPLLPDKPKSIHWLPQIEGDLGVRLSAATISIFEFSPTQSLLVIGTDCIDLTPELFSQTWDTLSNDADVVFGPTHDGGYYLLGLSEPNEEVFREIPWSTPETLEVSLERVKSGGNSSALMEVLSDVDELPDWNRVKHRLIEK